MSQSLYRKYRSRGFDEIVGQSHVTDLLKNAVQKGTFVHAYLFTGPRGTGKTSVARILAHALNQLPYTDDTMHLDIIEIDAASNRRIDDIRELREKVHIAPSSAKYKVYIIDEVHMLTGESFNALLKTLEEPPEHAIFILATTELHKVPATIVSRTQRFHFRPGTKKDIVKHLADIAQKEGIAISTAALELIATHSEGGFRDSVSLLDQVSSLSSKEISETLIEDLLGLAPKSQIQTLTEQLLAGDTAAGIATIHSLYDQGISPISVIEQLIRHCTAAAVQYPSLYRLVNELLEIPRSHAPGLKLIATVALFAESTDKQSASSHDLASEPAVTKPAATDSHKSAPTIDQISQKPEQTSKKPAQSTKPPQASNPKPLDWDVVLEECKKRTPALYSVARHAETTMDGETIKLAFQYALHRKKMQSDKYLKHLHDIIANLYDISPQIVISEKSKKPLNDTAAAVADIMGGGEAV